MYANQGIKEVNVLNVTPATQETLVIFVKTVTIKHPQGDALKENVTVKGLKDRNPMVGVPANQPIVDTLVTIVPMVLEDQTVINAELDIKEMIVIVVMKAFLSIMTNVTVSSINLFHLL